VKKNLKRKSHIDLEFLNEKFSVDRYLQLNQLERIEFRMELKKTIKTLQRNYTILWMSNENLVKKGMQNENKIAQAISILEEWASSYQYDRLFYIKECIADLKKHLLEEMFGGKQLFYDLDKNTIAFDTNYLPFILGRNSNFKLVQNENLPHK
jgi:hypothetical protein